MSNLSVPAYEPAPVNFRWLRDILPPAVLTMLYRLIPARVRRLWSPDGSASSHLALAKIMEGGGWSAFFGALKPRMKDGAIWIVDPE